MSSRFPRFAFGSLPARAADFEDAGGCNIPAANSNGSISLLGRLQQKLLSDEALVFSLQSGNVDALTVLFERHSPHLFRIARRILRNDAEAEDTIQQIFLDVFRSLHQFDPNKGNFKSWLIMFAYQRIFNCRRSLIARCFFQTESLDEYLPEPFIKMELISGLSAPETGILIEQILSQLQPHQRQTIELIYFQGLTALEVSVRTGETVRVVRHNLYRGLEALRKAFGGSSHSPPILSKGASR